VAIGGLWYNVSVELERKRKCGMEDCLLIEMEAAKARGEDVTRYVVRMERCRREHDVEDCEICRNDGLLPAQECVFKVYNLGVRS
jgi:hypothetical protein